MPRWLVDHAPAAGGWNLTGQPLVRYTASCTSHLAILTIQGEARLQERYARCKVRDTRYQIADTRYFQGDA